jgi:hypothetical protein
MKKETRGGKREGAGRKKKEPTKVISFRVPKNKADILKRLIRETFENK